MGRAGRTFGIGLVLVAAAAALAGVAWAQATAPSSPGEALLRADPTLSRALDHEKKGEARQASESYRVWLDAHATDAQLQPAYGEALLRFAAVETDARMVEHYLSAAPAAALRGQFRARLLAARAALLDSLGDVGGAAVAWEESSRAEPEQAGGAARRALWRAASLFFVEGVLDRAEALAREAADRSTAAADPELLAASRYLAGRVYAATSRPTDAEAAWRAVVEGQPTAASAPPAALALWALLLTTGRATDAAAALAVLEARYGGSPELELARSLRGQASRAVPALDPASLLEPHGLVAVAVALPPRAQAGAPSPLPSPLPEPAESAGAEAEAKDGLVAVLAGSYTDRANAERHAASLRKAGFDSRLIEATVKGKVYFRVVVGEPVAHDAAVALIGRLKDRNFESVPLPVKVNGSN